MKVGVDAVLLGAWTTTNSPSKVLDIGTGCGVIALMIAQRYPHATILGIDIDQSSIDEAELNFNNSPWRNRLEAKLMEFPADIEERKNEFDLIVSNPPYFDSGIICPTTPRERARHQGALTVFSLVEKTPSLLSNTGKLAIIFPTVFHDKLLEVAYKSKMHLYRKCYIRNNPKSSDKRIMMEFGLIPKETITTEHLTLFEDGEPTLEYLQLCKNFYLKF